MRTAALFTIYFLFFNISLYADKLNLTQKEKEWIKKHPVIKVSNQDDWVPYDFNKKGKASGYSVELIKKLAKKAGLQVKFVNKPTWGELLDEFNKDNIDLMHTMAWTESRSKKYIYSAPYMPYKNSFIVRKDDKNIINPDVQLIGKTIATGKDWHMAGVLKKRYPSAKVVEYKNSYEILKALSLGNVDVAVDDFLTIKHLMSEHIITNVKNGGYIEEKDRLKEYLYFVANKNNHELINIFNKAYEVLSTDEKLELQNKWFSDIKIKTTLLNNDECLYLQNKKVIKMCIDPNWMPYEKFDQNGNHIGMTSEYFNLFENILGVPIKPIKTNTWTDSIEAAKNRECDIYSLAMATPERKEYMDFTSPYLSIPLVLATKTNVPFINDIQYIKGKKIGIVEGYAFNELLRAEYPNIEVVDVKNINDGLQKVVNGELYGFIGTLASISYVFQNNFMSELKISGKFDEKWELGIGTRNDEPILLDIFEKAIQNIPVKTHQDILNRYIAIKYEKGTDYDLLVKILLFISVLAVIGIYYYRKLSLTNKELKKLQHKLVEQAHRDPLTNLYNRRYMHDVASNLLTISKREKTQLSIIMMDIDNFKQINDTYGHAAGDEVIKSLAYILTTHTRDSDIVARFGGEEFVVLLPNTDIKGASKIASKLRVLVETQTTKLEKNDLEFTVSLGVESVSESDKSIDDALNRADKALYTAKENGKNQVCLFEAES